MRRLAAAIACTASALSSCVTQPAEHPAADLTLRGATVYTSPDAEPLRDACVAIRDGNIVWIGPSAQLPGAPSDAVLDCRGLTVLAGFWNSHVHLFERKWADCEQIPDDELARQWTETFTRYGFTTVFDTGSSWDNTRRLRERAARGNGPRLHSTGEPLLAPGAMPSQRILAVLGFTPVAAPEVLDADQATRAVQDLVQHGVDAIKLHLQPPPLPAPAMPPAAIEAAVRVAHDAGKRVFLHPHTSADVALALRSGVDVIAHTTPSSSPWDAALLAPLRERRVALTPTLALWPASLRHDRASRADAATQAARAQLRGWIDAGGTVLFGTDAGAIDADPSPELALLHAAGMDCRALLAALTSSPADFFGEGDRRGRVRVGFAADLVVLAGDPARDLGAFSRVRYTLRDGRVVYCR